MAKPTFTRADYLRISNSVSVDLFYRYISDLEILITEHGWDLEKQFRSSWCAFKPNEHGKAAFGIGLTSDGPYLYIKRVRAAADAAHVSYRRYNESDDQVEIDLQPSTISLKSFEPLLVEAYRLLIAQ